MPPRPRLGNGADGKPPVRRRLAAWDASRAKVLAQLPELKTLQGTLATSPASLLAAMKKISDVRREVLRLGTYASLKGDENTKVTANAARRQLGDSLMNQFGEATSFVAPEIAAAGSAKIESFIAAEPGLAPHAYGLRSLLRQAAHTLSPSEEALMAAAGDPLSQPQQIFEILDNADLPWPKSLPIRGEP